MTALLTLLLGIMAVLAPGGADRPVLRRRAAPELVTAQIVVLVVGALLGALVLGPPRRFCWPACGASWPGWSSVPVRVSGAGAPSSPSSPCARRFRTSRRPPPGAPPTCAGGRAASSC